ncbi:uncharacterized protein LOC129267069 isoform X2 [Lytechinus pictus]|uniref:uncharacterized protein LOC129267069 isoform X2 n=1 Tax=Lytechinus pictus TaxID=7653 RepID=UPI0030B9E827
MEIQNLTMNLTGPLLDLVRVSVGSGTDPIDNLFSLAYADGNGYLESYTSSTNFTLFFNTGYLLIAMPKSVAGIFNMTFRVSAVECESPESPCYLSLHCLDSERDYCDGEVQCLDSGEDEYECEGCPYGLYPCYFDESICYNYTAVGCDGNYDCPGGSDEYNCTGCFACNGSSECLLDLQVCNFYNDCPDGEDEANNLCNHTEFKSLHDIQVGVWTDFSEVLVSQRILDDRNTPASKFYDFTHYAFESPEGSTLFMEIQNLTVNLTGPLLELVHVSAGYGTDPTDIGTTLAYANGYGYFESPSYSSNFSLVDNKGYLLIAIPKSVAGTFNITFRVTAIECEYPEELCNGSLHCLDRIQETCDGEVQCLDSGEDEYGCEECFQGEYCLYDYYKCVQPRDRCNGLYDCASGSDESDCPGCTLCNGTAWCPADIQVCDYIKDCPSNDDEAESRCNHIAFIDDVDLAPGESITVERSWLDGAYGDRNTPASNFYNFTHYVFTSPPGTTLFVEMQKIIVGGDPGPLQAQFKVLVGSGINPGNDENTVAYFGLYHNNTISNSIPDSVGYVLIAIPKDVKANVTFRVTAVECSGFSCPTSDPFYGNCISEDWVCDNISDCLDSSDEADCDACPDGLYPCYFNDSICLDYTVVGCDGNYDCPGGTDEYNCTDLGCFACPGFSSCLHDLQVCNYYNDCPYGEDETEARCKHSDFVSNIDIQVGVWTDFSEGFVRERTLDDRDTPASEFYDFTHYVFESPEGSTLFMEIQNLTMNLTGPLLDLVRVSVGYGTDPIDNLFSLAYADGNGYLESYTSSTNFTLFFNTGYLLIAMPKSVAGIFNMTFRVSAVECESPESPCYLSLHCLDSERDYCDGEVQCLDSGEDEYECEGCPDGLYPCLVDESICYNDTADVCDGNYDCPTGIDEYNCTGCFACPGLSSCLFDLQVCNYYSDCPDGEDETEDLCKHSEYISNIDIQVGVWTDFSEGFVRERTLDDRDTPASEFYDFTHYVFESPEGSTLFMEIQNLTMNLTGSLLGLVDVSIGAGTDPADRSFSLAYADGNGYLESYTSSTNFTLFLNTGYLLIAMPKSVAGIFNFTFRVSAIECESPESPCYLSLHCLDMEKDNCDGEVQCLDSGEDEYECEGCPYGLYPCYFDESICYNYTAVGCDGNYDCPGGSDEYNCTGCFACNGSSECLLDLQVCNFYNDCPDGEDEANNLCNHTEFKSLHDIQVGVWTDFSEVLVSQRTLDDRNTPASKFYDFTHYVFESPEGSTLFMEIQNVTVNLTGPLLELVHVSAGYGTDPTDIGTTLAYANGYGYIESPSYSSNFSLVDNEGYLLIAIPKSVAGTFNITFRVTAIECEYPEELCNGSLHCLDRIQETCDGEVQCLDSGEDEYGCEECFHGEYCWYEYECVQPRDQCNGLYDCASGSDESDCPGCTPCNGTGWCPADIQVCDYIKDCPSDDDEAENRCNHTAFINEVDLAPGESITIERSWLDGAYGDRDTPASNFYNFTHYVFNSLPGSTLFVEMHNITVDGDPGPLNVIFNVLVGSGINPGIDENNVAYFGLYHNYTMSNSQNFSIPDSVGYVLIAIPKDVQANVTFRVTAVECFEFSCPTSDPFYGNCISEDWVCDNITDCLDGSDEAECDVCPEGLYPCYFDDSICLNYTAFGCDGNYDCPGGTDEYNCTGCFACEGSTSCQYDSTVCDFFGQCSGGEDESEDLCRHSEFIQNVLVSTGQWVDITVMSGNVENRNTPASNFIDFTHYVFRGDPGTTLFMEIQNYTWSDGPLASLLLVYAGSGEDPTDKSSNVAFLYGDGYSGSLSSSPNFSLRSNTGYGLIGIPKDVNASIQLRVTAIACDETESLCNGSPHCVNLETDLCNGEYECVNSQEDELNCDEGVCDFSCALNESSCLYPHDYCDDEIDCAGGEDEFACDSDCFKCPGYYTCLYDSVVCDFYDNCYGGADEAESLCRDSEFIIPVDVTADEWITIEQRSGDAVEDRGTRASEFYDFYHYVFYSDPGATLYMELLNFTWSENAPQLIPLLRIIAGAGEDPASGPNNRAYYDATGYEYSISSLRAFSLTNSTGFVLLAFPKNVNTYVKFRVTANVSVPVDNEWHEVNNVIGVLQENGDYLEAIWRFYAPSDSYVLLFEVTTAYVLSPGSEVLFGTDPFFDPHVAKIEHFGTDIPFGIYDFYVLSDEAYVSIMVPVDSSMDETSLQFRVRAELHDCEGDQSPCVECSGGTLCSPVLDCSVSDAYRCPDV